MNFDVKEKRMRYSISEDIALLKEVIAINPFEDLCLWDVVHSNLNKTTGKCYSRRSVKEHTERLLKQYINGDFQNLRKIDPDELYLLKEQLLQNVKDLFDNARSRRKGSRYYCSKKHHNGCDILISDIFSCTESEFDEDSVMKSSEFSDLKELDELTSKNSAPNRKRFSPGRNFDNDASELNESSNEPTTANANNSQPALRGFKRKRMQCSTSTWNFLEKKLALDKELKERELKLQERDLELQERKLKLEEEKLKFEIRKLDLEEEERKARLKTLSVIESLEVEKQKLEIRKFEIEEEERKAKLKLSEFNPSIFYKLMEIINHK